MTIESKWFDIFLDVLSFVPNMGPIVRKLDSIKNDLKLKDVKYEIEKIWNVIDKNPLLSFEVPILKSLKLIENNELVPNFNFRKAESCMALLKEINVRSKFGRENDPFIECNECIRIIKNNIPTVEGPEKELKLVVHELEKEDLIHRHPYAIISPKKYFFCKTDRLFQKWDPVQDAKKVVELLVDNKQDSASPEYVDRQFKWGPRRLNSAIAYLHLKKRIEHNIKPESGEYFLPLLKLTREAYFFIENNK
ncbi:MAG TPA: hypothetical protein ACFYD6_03675 [Candidatus Brocadiia bacterium]|nr:hypothetical protein [Planctomycetota bacterium]MDO8092620.1 hypothetical protein [Candidatus Brocadiales bacterium]